MYMYTFMSVIPTCHLLSFRSSQSRLPLCDSQGDADMMLVENGNSNLRTLRERYKMSIKTMDNVPPKIFPTLHRFQLIQLPTG